jgi:hypothetical protein
MKAATSKTLHGRYDDLTALRLLFLWINFSHRILFL